MRICCWIKSRRGPNNLEKSWDEIAKHLVGRVAVTVAWRGSSSMRACVLWEVTASRRWRGGAVAALWWRGGGRGDGVARPRGARKTPRAHHLAEVVPPFQREQVLLVATRSFRTLHLAVLDQVKVVSRFAFRHYFTTRGELDALQGVGDSL